ncbi:hypothetical protein Tco_0510308, partial [Tanacetum coccineum]
KSALGITSLRSIDGNSKGDNGVDNGSGGDGKGNSGEGIYRSGDDSVDNEDGGGDEGSAAATTKMSTLVAADIGV